MLKTKKSDVIISGAGSAGLALALMLSKAGFTSILIDPVKKPSAKALTLSHINTDIGTRTTALMNDNIDILNKIDVLDPIKPYCEDLRILSITDAGIKTDKTVDFSADDIGLEQFGLNIPNKVLSLAMMQKALKDKNITLYFETEITDFLSSSHDIEVKTNTDKALKAQLLIGADGRQSKTRALTGIKTTEKDNQQIAMTCILKAEKHHNFTSTEFHYKGGPFTLVPLPDNYVSLVWVEKVDTAEYWLKQSQEELEKQINLLSKDLLGTLSLETEVESYPLISLQAQKIIDQRIALIAEAAHVLHPMGAQGLNASLRDVGVLCTELVKAYNCGADIGSTAILSNYAHTRQKDSSTRNLFSFTLNKLVANESKALKLLRRFGLDTLDQHPQLKQKIMAFGLAPYKANA